MDQAIALDFETSASTEKLDASLAKAQGAFRIATKDAANSHFKTKYADLASVWDACRDALSSNGVSVTQWPIHSTDGRAHLVTRLAAGGEWMKGHFSMPVGKADAHGYGSAVTYLKRYALTAALGIASGEDDDGNGPVGNNGATERHPRADDPIHVAKEAALTTDKHLLVNGETRSQYAVDKERKQAAKANGNGLAQATKWVTESIELMGSMVSREQIQDWWRANADYLTRFREKYSDEYERLCVAADERRDSVPSVMDAG